MKNVLKFGSILSLCLSSSAFAQINVVRQPLPEYQSLADVPIEFSDEGVMQAQHIRPGDISPEEYQALLAEADRVRAYQTRDGYANSSEYDYTYESTEYVTSPAASTSHTYQNELPLYVTPQSDTRYTGQTTTYSSAPIQSQATSSASHYVVKGDTLFSISRRYDLSVADIKFANGLANNIIQPGQFLSLPNVESSASLMANTNTVVAPYSLPSAPTYVRSTDPLIVSVPSNGIYAVLPGDTLYSIARRACVRVDALQRRNASMEANNLQPGQRLTMPSGHCL